MKLVSQIDHMSDLTLFLLSFIFFLHYFLSFLFSIIFSGTKQSLKIDKEGK